MPRLCHVSARPESLGRGHSSEQRACTQSCILLETWSVTPRFPFIDTHSEKTVTAALDLSRCPTAVREPLCPPAVSQSPTPPCFTPCPPFRALRMPTLTPHTHQIVFRSPKRRSGGPAAFSPQPPPGGLQEEARPEDQGEGQGKSKGQTEGRRGSHRRRRRG